VPDEPFNWVDIRIRNLDNPDIQDEWSFSIVDKDQFPLSLFDFHNEWGMTDLAVE
jgi:hypothetical protein